MRTKYGVWTCGRVDTDSGRDALFFSCCSTVVSPDCLWPPPHVCMHHVVYMYSYIRWFQVVRASPSRGLSRGGHVLPHVGVHLKQRPPDEARVRVARAMAVDSQGVPAPVPPADAHPGLHDGLHVEGPSPARGGARLVAPGGRTGGSL